MNMLGIPKETKDGERRVVLDPDAVATLTASGIEVRVETSAGVGAGFLDEDYRCAGATIVSTAEDAWGAQVVIKVKEPVKAEWKYFRPGLVLFSYLHLASAAPLATALIETGVTAIAFETVSNASGLPLLAPMSEIAGRAAPLIGANLLKSGPGIMLGGAAGVAPARVVVIGLGVAGVMAARGARGLDAEVTGIDVDLVKLRDARAHNTITSTVVSSKAGIARTIANADLVIGAALVPGARAPIVVTADHVASMRPGSVVVDLAVDQGGCIETTRPTSLSNPTYEVGGVAHYCVTNVPGQFPQTASRALSAAAAPHVLDLMSDPDTPKLIAGYNVKGGKIVHPVVAASLGL